MKSWVAALAVVGLASGVPAQDADQSSSDTPPPVILGPPPTAQQMREAAATEELMRTVMEESGGVGLVTLGMDRNEKIVFCDGVAQFYASIVAQKTDRERRLELFGEIWAFKQRLIQPMEESKRKLGESGLNTAIRKRNEAIALHSMVGDPLVEDLMSQGDDVDVAFAKSMAMRCGQFLDEWGIARLSGEPPAEYLADKTRFRFRGDGYAEVFADTGLAPHAEQMCFGGKAPDFAGAPLEQRGKDGMSLLDWAIECEDRASFDALIAAGADLEAPGLWQNPPLVNAASVRKIWFLRRLLDAGVPPDTEGRSGTALSEAYDDLDATNAGDNSRAAFNLLRERGASLNFPNYRRSMWQVWSFRNQSAILENWDQFDSDAVTLGEEIEFALGEDWVSEDQQEAAREVIRRLSENFGVCFPIERSPYSESERDERGFKIQSDCPRTD